MSTRYQWFRIDPFTQNDLRKASEIFIREKYSERRGYGVIVGEVRPDHLSGEFIEKTILKERIVDPFGKEAIFEIPQYRKLSFELSTTYPQMEMVNCPRTVGQFLTFVGDSLENRVAIAPVSFDVGSVIRLLKANKGAFSVQRVHAKNIVLSTTVSAEAVVQGTEDVNRLLSKFVGKHRFEMASARIHFSMEDKEYLAEMASGGRIRLITGDGPRFGQEIRRVLALLRDEKPANPR